MSTTVTERPPTSTGATASRSPLPRGRLSGRHVLVILAGVVSLVANLAVLRAGTPTTTVVVAADDLVAGERVTSDSLVAVQVDGGGDVLDRLLDRLPSSEMVAVRDLPAGEPLRWSDLVATVADDPRLRHMSLPIEPEHAAGGRIVAGDRVDVIAVIDGVATAIITSADVVAVADQQDQAFGTLGAFHVTILVDTADALCLASALSAGEIHLVLATGADTPAATGCPS